MPPNDTNLESVKQRFFTAVEAGDIPALRATLSTTKEALAWQNADGKTALMCTAIRGDTQTGRILLEAGAPVDAINENKSTALLFAATGGQKDFVELLISFGAHVNHKNAKGTTATMAAAYGGHAEIVSLLVETYGADISRADNNGTTAQKHAQNNGHPEISDWLAQAEKRFSTQRAEFFGAVHANDAKKLQSILSRHKMAITWENQDGLTGLMSAAINGQTAVARVLLENAAPADATNSNGSTSLMMAAAAGHAEIVDLLINYKANVNKRNAKNATPLMAAAWSGQEEVATLLVEKYTADATLSDVNGLTAAMHAAAKGYPELAALLERATTEQNSKRPPPNQNQPSAEEYISPALRSFIDKTKSGKIKEGIEMPETPETTPPPNRSDISPALLDLAEKFKKNKLA